MALVTLSHNPIIGLMIVLGILFFICFMCHTADVLNEEHDRLKKEKEKEKKEALALKIKLWENELFKK